MPAQPALKLRVAPPARDGDRSYLDTVLVVSPDPGRRAELEDLVDRGGWLAIAAGSAQEAAWELSPVLPHLVVIDVPTPEESDWALELIDQIRSRGGGDGVPVVVVTPRESRDLAVAAFERKADDVVSGRPHVDELIARLGVRLERRPVPRDALVRDPVTGALTPASFADQIEHELERVARGGQPGVLALLQFDELPELEVRHGLRARDEILAQVVTLIREDSRDIDFVGHARGVLAILMPATPGKGGQVRLERLSRLLSSRSLMVAGAIVRLTPDHRLRRATQPGLSTRAPRGARVGRRRCGRPSSSTSTRPQWTPGDCPRRVDCAAIPARRRGSAGPGTPAAARSLSSSRASLVPLRRCTRPSIRAGRRRHRRRLPTCSSSRSRCTAARDLARGHRGAAAPGAARASRGVLPPAAADHCRLPPQRGGRPCSRAVEASSRPGLPGPPGHPRLRHAAPARRRGRTPRGRASATRGCELLRVEGRHVEGAERQRRAQPVVRRGLRRRSSTPTTTRSAASFQRACRWLGGGCDVVQGHCVVRNGDAIAASPGLVAVEFEAIYAVSHPGRAKLHGFGLFGGSNGFWRTDCLHRTRMRSTMLTEDIDSSMRAVEVGARIASDGKK